MVRFKPIQGCKVGKIYRHIIRVVHSVRRQSECDLVFSANFHFTDFKLVTSKPHALIFLLAAGSMELQEQVNYLSIYLASSLEN